MIGRRVVLAGAVVLPALGLASPSLACRAARLTNPRAYAATIDGLFQAAWRRDWEEFRRFFELGDGEVAFDSRPVFEEILAWGGGSRNLGDIFYSGSLTVVQVISPIEADQQLGICGGMISAHLYLVEFYSGLSQPVVQRLVFLGNSVLAVGERSVTHG